MKYVFKVYDLNMFTGNIANLYCLVTLHLMLCIVVTVRTVTVAAHHSIGKTLTVAERHTQIHQMTLQNVKCAHLRLILWVYEEKQSEFVRER